MAKCIRCGGCCESSLCIPGQELYGADAKPPCPGLRYENNIAICGPYQDGDDRDRRWIDSEVGIGFGFGCTGKARKEKDA